MTDVCEMPVKQPQTPSKALALLLVVAGGSLILGIFWMASRYPSLLGKAASLPGYEPKSFVYTNVLMEAGADAGFWEKVVATFVNWCWSMRIGMTFGLTFGAMLHTAFRYFPLRTGDSVYLNTLKGILIGAPAGVCVNCAVPVACGLTRARNKVELALGFMLSSPSLNIIVVSMIVTAFPWQFAAVHFSVIAIVLLIVLPLMVKMFHGTQSAPSAALHDMAPVERPSAGDVVKTYLFNLWKLFRTAVPMMLAAAAMAAVAVQLIPFEKVFADAGFAMVAAAAFLTTLLPAPIAMEVLVAHHLFTAQVAAPFVMLFLCTLGSYSILPMIYLWQEVSRKIAVGLYLSFVVLGIAAAHAVTWLM